MSDQQTFFEWQCRALGGLLLWGAGSAVVGAGLAHSANTAIRHIGLQAIGWGLVDLALAVNGRRDARRQARSPGTGVRRPAARFRAIIAVNALLDIGYVLGGARLAWTAGWRQDRRGIGLGILLQGAFLLGYDLLLLRGVARWLRRL